MTSGVSGMADDSVRPIAVAELGERYRRYRLSDPSAEEEMARSLRRWGQSSPLAVCWREERLLPRAGS